MILAAGLSPAWQQIVVLDALAVGEVNRAREVRWSASGKVLNVGLAAHNLGSSSRTLALVGGSPGDAIRREFGNLDVECRWITSQAATRVCTTILDRDTGSTTELVENPGPILADELETFRSAYFEEAVLADVIVLTGSLPAGVSPKFYRELLAKTVSRVVLDAQGEPLLAALEMRPFVVKPNREELGRTLGRRLDTDSDLHAAMREFCRRGATWVVVTQGKSRVWVCSQGEFFSAEPPPCSIVNPIGSGDCLAAGIAVGLARGEDLPQAVRLGIAAATQNVGHLLAARLDRQRVAALRETIEVHPAL